MADPITWKVEDFTKELLGKYATWLVTCGKAGKPLQSYRLYLCGLKTKVESVYPSTYEKSVFFRDPKWHTALFRGAKRSHNKREAELGEVTSRKKARYCDNEDREETCDFFINKHN